MKPATPVAFNTHATTGSTCCQHEESYRRVREHTLALVQGLSEGDLQLQSMPDTSPGKWHLAHVTWFFETFVLKPWVSGYSEFQPEFAYLFNSYYNAVGEQFARPQRGLLSRPSLSEILAYREHVDRHLLSWLPQASATQWERVELGLNHEQQHQELLLMDLKHGLSCNPLYPALDGWPSGHSTATALAGQRSEEWISFEGGLHECGSVSGPVASFAYDNEGPRHKRWLEAFAIAPRLVTQEDYLAFMDDGGYQNPRWWLSDGWAWRQAHCIEAPLYWQKINGQWQCYTLCGLRALDPKAAVLHLSYYEADAFASWAGKRLPSEFEWEVAATALGADDAGLRFALHPTASASDWFGTAWQWTSSDYAPYPGYQAAEGAIGEYNGKFMCNQRVLRGSACVTPPGHSRNTYRNFYYPHQRWMFSGLRLAENR